MAVLKRRWCGRVTAGLATVHTARDGQGLCTVTGTLGTVTGTVGIVTVFVAMVNERLSAKAVLYESPATAPLAPIVTSIARVPFGMSAAALRASISVWSSRSAALTGPIDRLPSEASVALRKLAVTTISAGSLLLPPRSPLRVATCWPLSIKASKAGSSSRSMTWVALLAVLSGPPAK